MLESAEYTVIKADYDQISTTSFPRDYFYPENTNFAHSDALFPPDKLASIIGPEYEIQCHMLCYGPFPTWSEIRARFEELRPLL